MTEKFTTVIWACFILVLIGLINCLIEMINKFVKNQSLTILTGVIDSLIAVAFICWVVWASIERLDRNGKICAGATMNVTEEARPYAYKQGVFL